MAARNHRRNIPSTRSLAKYVLVVCLFGLCLSAYPQDDKPIKRESLLRALRIGGVSSKEYVRLIEAHGVAFQLSAADEQRIRRLGKYLGKKGLDDLVAAIHVNYRVAISSSPATSPTSSPSSDLPLTALTEIPLKGGSPQRLDVLMKAAGYTGSTTMAVLIVASNETNENDVILSMTPDLKAKNGWRLEGGGSYFNFPGGENTARIYVSSVKDGKIDVTYRPKSVPQSSTSPASPDGGNVPINFDREVFLKSGAIRRLDAILKDAGYKGPMLLQALYINNSDTNTGNIYWGQADMDITNSPHIRPGFGYNFPGGADATQVYLLTDKDMKITINLRSK